jgi:hypothetical protein
MDDRQLGYIKNLKKHTGYECKIPMNKRIEISMNFHNNKQTFSYLFVYGDVNSL